MIRPAGAVSARPVVLELPTRQHRSSTQVVANELQHPDRGDHDQGNNEAVLDSRRPSIAMGQLAERAIISTPFIIGR